MTMACEMRCPWYLAAALARDNGWHYRRRTSWQDYKSGYLAGVSFSAAYRF